MGSDENIVHPVLTFIFAGGLLLMAFLHSLHEADDLYWLHIYSLILVLCEGFNPWNDSKAIFVLRTWLNPLLKHLVIKHGNNRIADLTLFKQFLCYSS